MGKRNIKLKKVSDNLSKVVTPIDSSKLRPSAGRENTIAEYYNISVDNLLPYEKQARKNFNEEELAGLSETIKEHGVRSPLTVIKAQDLSGKFYVISGERRLIAAQKVGLSRVPCIILEDTQNPQEIALVENIQRADLHPLELAAALAELDQSNVHGDKKVLASKLGLSQQKFSETLGYNSLPESIKNVLLDRDIRTRSVFRRLKSCQNEESMMSLLGLDQITNPRRKNKDMIRFSLKDGKVSVKKSIANLSSEQKNELIQSLESMIDEIKLS